MTHEYPFGAIETIEALAALKGKTVFHVHGLGASSWLTEYQDIGEPLAEEPSPDILVVYGTVDNEYAKEGWVRSRFCPGDVNITSHHNSHYVFHVKEDAEAYLHWAKENTSPPDPLRFMDWEF